MSAAAAVKDVPRTPQDTRRKRKAKDASAGKHEAKRVRTQEEEDALVKKEEAAKGKATPAKAGAAVPAVKDEAGEEDNAPSKPVEDLAAQAEGKVEASKKKRRHGHTKDAWYTSDPSGGRFLSIDPLFSRDERYIIFATAKAVHIYSTVTSLLVRTLPVNTNQSISAYAISSSDPSQLYVSDAAGFIALWDWVAGKKIGRWDLASRVCGMATSAIEEEGTKGNVVYTLEKGQSNTITAHRMRSRQDGKESEAVVLLKVKKPLQSFKVIGDGRVIVAAFQDSVMVGKAKEGTQAFKDTTYTWREIKCTESVTSFDVRLGRDDSKGGPKTPRKGISQHSRDSVNLAIGGARGTIFCYEDILNRLIQAENPKKETHSSSLVPRIFHWHRNAVGSVKWSLDGNYLLSGGQETVLVLWQLDTAKRQFLPHLTSAIDGLVVSPSGASYAVQLADNSVIVLKTTDLTPKANVAGVQAHTISLDTSSGDKELLDEVYRTPAVVNPQRSSQLLLAVPASQPRTEPNDTHLPVPFLQTYDISSNHHVFRQAITRNNATVFNIGGNIAPNATKLREPDVRHIQISSDGSWLATAEEWLPPAADVEHLAADKSMTEDERRFRREVYLKFWSWNQEKQIWTLETRIDAPHQHPEDLFSGRVFDLAYDPVSSEFATVGEDGYVRFWAPKTRLHDGTVVKGSKGQGLVTWSNRCSTRLETSGETLDGHSDIPVAQIPVNARLAYAPDASVIAASQEFYGTHAQGLVSFIDPSSGQIRYSRGGLYTTGLVDIGFVGQHFIILSNSLSVWDLVDDTLSYGYSFRPLGLSRAQKAQIAHLAINEADSTFAISLPAADRQTGAADASKRQSRIVVFDPSTPRPVYSVSVPKIVTALVPARGAKGFVAVNTTAEIRVVAPKTSASLQLVAPLAQPEQDLAAIKDEDVAVEPVLEDELEGDDQDAIVDPVTATDEDDMEIEDTENDRPVVRPEQLASVFDVGPSFALPPVKDLFEAVVKLYARRPRSVEVAA